MSAKAILFMRVSTDAQIIESQPKVLRDMAHQDGFSDENIISIGEKESAIKLGEEERRSLEKLKHYIETDNIDTVYVFELSRIARTAKVLYSVRDYLVEHQVQLICKEPQFVLLEKDRSKGIRSDSNLVFSIFGALAEQEMKLKKERFARGRKYQAETNRFNGGRIPFGYKVNYDKDKLIEINEEDAEVVRHIYNLYEQGYSQTQIARLLLGTSMERNSTLSVVHNILSNKAYTGRKIKAHTFERSYPQIITPEQYDRCRQIAAEHKHTIDKSTHIYYGSKIVRCPECEGRFGATASKGYYFCYNAYNAVRDVNVYGNTQYSNKITVSINILDSLLWHIASAAEARHILVDSEQNRMEYDKKIGDIERLIDNKTKQKEALSAKRERLFDGWVEGRCGEDKYKKKTDEFDEEERNIDGEIAEYKYQIEQLKHLIDDLSSTWKSINGQGAIQISDFGELVAKIRETSDDKIRSEIVHKHIMKVYLYDEKPIQYTFTRGQKEARVKRIEIHKYQGEPVSYYFLPFAGKKCLFWDNPAINPDSLVELQYLSRFKDKYKKKQARKADEFKDYYKITTLSDKIGKSTYLIRKAVREGRIPTVFKFGTYYISQKDAKAYFDSLNNKGDYIEAKEAARELGVDIQTMWAMLRRGEIPAHKDGNRYNIPIDQFEAYKKRIGK